MRILNILSIERWMSKRVTKNVDRMRKDVYTYGYKIEKGLQGRVRFPTGGKAHEPQGMIR